LKTRCWLAAVLFLLVALPLQAAKPGSPTAKPTQASAPRDVNALYRQALIALERGDYTSAREQLEQVVQAWPDHAGAWIDLALACRQGGDTEAAIEHLAYARQRFPLPPPLEQQIALWQKQWEAPPAAHASDRWQREIRFGLGYDSNANSGLALSQISLSLPGESLILPLDPDYRPRGDSFAQLDYLAWGPAWSVEGRKLNPFALVRHRQNAHESDYDQSDFQAGVVYPFAQHPDSHWQATLIARHYRLGGRALSNSQRVILQQLRPMGDCRLALGGEMENRLYSSVSLDGTQFWLGGNYACKTRLGTQLSAHLRLGHEVPHDSSRPGGGHSALEATFQASHAWPDGRHLLAAWQIGRGIDDDGYSPVLENNASRRLTRHHLHVTFSQPLRERWDARFSLDLQRQEANLPLFEQRANQAMIGLAYRFD